VEILMNIKSLSLIIAFSSIALLQNTSSEAQAPAGENLPWRDVPTVTPEHLVKLLNGGELGFGGQRWDRATQSQHVLRGETVGKGNIRIIEQTPSVV